MKHEIEQSIVEIQTDAQAGEVDALFCFHHDLTVFAGHFPNLPLVPGIFLIEASRVLAERLTGEALRIDEVASARFTGEIHPDVDVSATVAVSQGEGCLICEASFAVGDVKAASVRLFLRRP